MILTERSKGPNTGSSAKRGLREKMSYLRHVKSEANKKYGAGAQSVMESLRTESNAGNGRRQ